MFSTGRESLGEISLEGLPLTQHLTGSVSALPVSLPAGTLRGSVVILSLISCILILTDSHHQNLSIFELMQTQMIS